jgi:hypothetical protein
MVSQLYIEARISFHCKIFFPVSPLIRPHNSKVAAEKEERPGKISSRILADFCSERPKRAELLKIFPLFNLTTVWNNNVSLKKLNPSQHLFIKIPAKVLQNNHTVTYNLLRFTL